MAGPGPGGPGRRARWIVAGALAAALLLVQVTLAPPDGFFSGDIGIKRLQVEAVVAHGPWHPAIDDPARDLDPDLRFRPEFTVPIRGELYGLFPPVPALLAAPFVAALGPRGLFVLPALWVALAFLAIARLAERVLPARHALPAALVVTLGTPLPFYGLEFWEHAPATALVAWAAVAALGALDGRAAGPRLGAAGLLCALAAAFRIEALFALPALALARWIGWPTARRTIVRESSWFVAGFAVGAVPHLVLGLVLYGTALPLQLRYNLAGASPLGERLADVLRRNVLPEHGAIAAVALVVAFAALVAWSRSRRAVIPLAAHAVAGCWVALAVIVPFARAALLHERFGHAFGYYSLFPTWLLLPLLPYWLLARDRAPRERELGTLLCAGTLFVAFVVAFAPVPGGMQWGARMLLPAAPLLGLAALGGAMACAARGTKPAIAAIVVLAVGVQLVGVAFVVHVKRFNAAIARGVAAATERGEPVVTDLFWIPQLAAPVYRERRFLFVQSVANIEEIGARAAAAGIDRLALVTSGEESALAPPAAIGTPPAFVAAGSRPLSGRGLVVTSYRRP